MRKLAAAALAAPVYALLYLPLLLRRRYAFRAGLAFGLAAVVGAGALAVSAARPATINAQKVEPIVAVPAGVLRTDLRVRQAPDAAVQIAFTEPMNPESVLAAIDVEPGRAVRVDWNADRTIATVAPLGRWATGTYYTITVEPGALSAAGVPLTRPVRAAFLIRPTTTATIAASAVVGDRIRTDTTFVVEFSARIDPATLEGAFRLEPPVAGSWAPDAAAADAGTAAARWRFTPLGRLAADTDYTIDLSSGVRDADGEAIEVAPLEVRTAAAPKVVRFRPVDGAEDVERAAKLSVRFTEPMDHGTTEAAFTATVDGKALKGAFSWAEGDTVLVFDPAANLDYDETVELRVGPAATSGSGVELTGTAKATFTTEEKPAPVAPPRSPSPPPSGGGSGGSAGSGGGSVGSGSWTAVERYYLGLMNCTRTGGWVTSTGSCKDINGPNVGTLMLDSGISTKVSRPYAKKLATGGKCDHFIGGGPDDRLRAAGYTSYIWAENLGCRSGDPKAAVTASHRFFQDEKFDSDPTDHYTNLMSTKYDRAGIGVWVYAGRVRLVVDFYHPR